MSLRAMEAGYVPPQEHHGAAQVLFPQYEDIDQQNECYMVGMWTFLVQEIMFFGALFLAYSIYRTLYFDAYLDAHHFLSVPLGTINTGVLLTSSFTMVMAVYCAQHAKKWGTILCLVLTILCSFGFLGIKYIEYSKKINEGLFPGYHWDYSKALGELAKEKAESGGGAAGSGAKAGTTGEAEAANGSNIAEVGSEPGYFDAKPVEGMNTFAGTVPKELAAPTQSASAAKEEVRGRRARLFFSIYFTMTGLHGLHVLVGIIMMVVIIVMILMNHPQIQDYMPTEMVGLYWHFVDIVWIFLFPLMYLIS
jgi:cytochrome c oxidase subunit 3